MGVPGSRLSKSAIAAALMCVVGTATSVALSLATSGGGGPWPWITVVVLTLVAAVLTLVKDQPSRDVGHRYPPPQQPWPYPGGYQRPYYPPPRDTRRGGVSVAAVAMVLLLIGGVASGVVYGASYLAGYITSNEPGTDVLVREVPATESALTLTVRKVEVTRHFTKVGLRATNAGPDSMSLPLFSNCTFDAGGPTKSADTLRSEWPDSIAPGQTVNGIIVFDGEPSATTATLSFARVHVQGFGGPSAISVTGIELRSPDSTDQASARVVSADRDHRAHQPAPKQTIGAG